MGDQQTKWPLDAAWRAAVQVTEGTFGLTPGAITAPSRGRGPRPPAEVREPKKLAIYLANSLADCDYAALARHVGLHKDTVHSHCAAVREALIGDEDLAQLVDTLGSVAIVNMEVRGIVANAPKSSPLAKSAMRQRLRALRGFLEVMFEEAFEAASDEAQGSSDRSPLHPTAVQKKFRAAA